MNGWTCGHFADAGGEICVHLRDRQQEDYVRWFRGVGLSGALLCESCANQPEQAPLVTLCAACIAAIELEGYWSGILGQPSFAERATDLRFMHTVVAPLESISGTIVDIQPVDGVQRALWIALMTDSTLVEFDLDARTTRQIATLPAGNIDLTQRITLHLAPNARFAAVVNRFGRFGSVIDLATGALTMVLDRGAYHENVCVFSAAFFQHGERTLLVHATNWNRLDISDPATGMLLTARGPTSYRQGEPRPEHYLDYFHCGLVVSPNHQWVIDNGWVWHPWGYVRGWNLHHWIEENVWESENGLSLRNLCDRAYFWDGPICWIDDTTLAIWGEGRDADQMLPAVHVFNVATGADLYWLAGPDIAPHEVWPPHTGTRGWIVYDKLLFAISPAHGTGVWDLTTSERLLHDEQFVPHRYHCGAAQFLSFRDDGAIVLSQLHGDHRTGAAHPR